MPKTRIAVAGAGIIGLVHMDVAQQSPTCTRQKIPPAQSVPANDGRRPHIDHRIAPIEEPGKQCAADASRVIHTSGPDPALDVPRELSAKNQILSADRAGRAQERYDQPQDVRSYPDDCTRQLLHAPIMPESDCVCWCLTPKCPRRELLRTTQLLKIRHP